jgi:hypothetical protein
MIATALFFGDGLLSIQPFFLLGWLYIGARILYERISPLPAAHNPEDPASARSPVCSESNPLAR